MQLVFGISFPTFGEESSGCVVRAELKFKRFASLRLPHRIGFGVAVLFRQANRPEVATIRQPCTQFQSCHALYLPPPRLQVLLGDPATRQLFGHIMGPRGYACHSCACADVKRAFSDTCYRLEMPFLCPSGTILLPIPNDGDASMCDLRVPPEGRRLSTSITNS